MLNKTIWNTKVFSPYSALSIYVFTVLRNKQPPYLIKRILDLLSVDDPHLLLLLRHVDVLLQDGFLLLLLVSASE